MRNYRRRCRKQLESISESKSLLEENNEQIEELTEAKANLAEEEAKDNPNEDTIESLKEEISWIEDSIGSNNATVTKQECDDNQNCLTESSFMLNTTDVFWLWNSASTWSSSNATTKQAVNNLLWTVIQKLMIALWTIALLIMTIWAGYIILSHWTDEYISKWKIFS